MSANAATPALSAGAATTGSKNPATLFLVIGLIGLAIGLVALVIGASSHDSRLGLSWLVGFAFWFSVMTGLLFLTQISYLFDAGWSAVVRRPMEHLLAGFPWLWLLLLPILVIPWMMGDPGLVWKWLNPAAPVPGVTPMTVSEDVLYLHKAGYLNAPFFVVRLLTYAVVLCGLAYLLRRNSFQNDVTPDARYWGNCRKVSAAGIFLTSFCATFAAFDLFMSLAYHWFSTMYGVWFFSASMRAGIATLAVTCFLLSTRGGPLTGIYRRPHAYFLGCLALAFTVFWAYISFSQYFLIYNANIPEETFWYNIRELNLDGSKSGWWYVSLSLIFFHFLVPFFLLLWYPSKIRLHRFLFISLWILAFTLVDMWFNVVPMQKPADNILGYYVLPFLSPALLVDLAVVVGMGGVLVWAALRSMARHHPIPIHDPRILESIHASE